ncbi:cdc42 effector protein 3 [Esox lucius]|uniref:CRIB domain-containing protein n=1 Tax=Esox lucius TaxID=8010 RepID=A0AAY5L1L7_ESOLU|nr:cdc42 effector protein 3 [Esox lucius]
MPLKTSVYRSLHTRWSWKSQKNMEVLSVNMISNPLADFRHVSHIGNHAHSDSFGDLSFLKGGHSLLLQSSQSEQNLFLACDPPPKPPRLNLDHTKATEGTRTNTTQSGSERRKKCNSLPLLDSEEGEAEGDGEMEAGVSPIQKVMVISHSSGSTSSGTDEDSTQTSSVEPLQRDEEDDSFSFNLDLGPSILDDVLRVMDRLHY